MIDPRVFRGLIRGAFVTAIGLGILVTPALVWPSQALADPPLAIGDTLSVAEDGAPTTVDVLDNDTTDDMLTIISATDPAHGTVVVAGDGMSLTYAPDANYNGLDTFNYTVRDGSAVQATASVDVTIAPVNDAPVAVDDPSSTCSPFKSLYGGTFLIPEDWYGSDGSGWFVFFGECDLLANDTDVDGDQLTWEVVVDPAHGDVIFVADGWWAYNVDADYSTLAGDLPGGQWVSDSFTYRAFDGTTYSAPATMNFWIVPMNDAPTFTPGTTTLWVNEDQGAFSQAWASNMSVGPSIESYQTISFQVDFLSNPGNLFSVAPAIDAAGNLTFETAPNKSGTATLYVRAKDDGGVIDFGSGWYPRASDTSAEIRINITVWPVPDPPVAVDDIASTDEDTPTALAYLANDTDVDSLLNHIVSVSDPAHGTAHVSGYEPDPDWSGIDTFTYTVADPDGNEDTATVTVTVSPVNDAPIAVDDILAMSEDGGPTVIDVLGNDTDVDNVLTNFVVTSGPAHGTLTTAVYEPDPDWYGTDSFSYSVNDGAGSQDTATVTITVSPINDAPIADSDAVAVTEDGGSTLVSVLVGDTDVDGDVLHVTSAVNGAKGTVTIDGDGLAVHYTPNANVSGSDTFSYTVSDGNGATDSAIVSVTIAASNDPPDAVDDGSLTPLSVGQGMGPMSLAIIGNDTSAPDTGETLSIVAVSQGAHGIVAISVGGLGVTYDPSGLYAGPDQFTYTISDGHGATDTATVYISVIPDVTPPVAIGPRIVLSSAVGASTVRASIVWSATELQSGISLYKLQQQTDGGAWTAIPLSSPTAAKVKLTLATGHTYRFRVRATDGLGNVGVYTTSRLIRL